MGKEFWRKFEEEVELVVSKLGDAVVQRDVLVPGVLSGRLRQIDVLATGVVAGYEMTVIFEAKCYRGSVQIGRIDELVGKALDVAAQRAVLYAPKGFSAGAIARAAGTQSSPLRVGVVQLEVDWEESQTTVGSASEAGTARVVGGAPGPLLYDSPFAYDLLDRPSPTLPSYRAVPATTDDYGRFLRGEAALHVTR